MTIYFWPQGPRCVACGRNPCICQDLIHLKETA